MLTEHIQKVIDQVSATDARFKELYRAGVNVSPIPFFGDLACARILTVGVNPSWTEFQGRAWPSSDDLPKYLERLSNYFHQTSPQPHTWFKRWEEALNQLGGASYRTNAAHLDLSPRATMSMSDVSADSFLSMVANDIGLFFEALALCVEAKVLLFAGCVTNKFYMDDYIAEQAPKYGFELVGNRKKPKGEAKVASYHLKARFATWPVFFCSVSPSAPNSHMLTRRIMENRPRLLSYLDCACATNN